MGNYHLVTQYVTCVIYIIFNFLYICSLLSRKKITVFNNRISKFGTKETFHRNLAIGSITEFPLNPFVMISI